MALFARNKPDWLDETRDFCRTSGIKIMAWGPDVLTVEAKSPDRAAEIARQLSQLGFKPLPNEDDDYAGILDLSRNPEALQSKIAARIATRDVSRRPWSEQVQPLIWALACILLVPGLNKYPERYWIEFPLGLLALFLLFWDGSHIWGWRLEILPDALRVRRHFRWSTIPWDQIRAVVSVTAGRTSERVVLKLTSHATENLGTFLDSFARILRDRLRHELSARRAA
jgi:hypothetical protein